MIVEPEGWYKLWWTLYGMASVVGMTVAVAAGILLANWVMRKWGW